MKRDSFAAVLVTVYIIIYLFLLQYESPLRISILMVLFFPVVLLWMIYTFLKCGQHHASELGDDEFGYQDKSKSDLGIIA